jgi:hypothetical protein
MIKVFSKAALLLVVSYSYCYSETLIGRTPNAAINGNNWSMPSVLPSTEGLSIDGILYRYTIEKDPNTDAYVMIRNKDTETSGYIYQRSDNWSNLPGSTKVGYDPILSTPSNRFGDGEILVDGDGTISDVTVMYNYTYNTCYNPLSDPSCPGYLDALYKYLLDNNLLNGSDSNNPYYNEWVQAQLNSKVEIEQVAFITTEEEPEEEIKEKSMEDLLSISGAAEKLADSAQQEKMLAELSSLQKLNSYKAVTIDGGTYTDSVTIVGGTINDNGKALRNLASDALHKDMVRSQYNNPTIETEN